MPGYFDDLIPQAGLPPETGQQIGPSYKGVTVYVEPQAQGDPNAPPASAPQVAAPAPAPPPAAAPQVATAPAASSSYFDDLIPGSGGGSQVARLPSTPAMRQALAADAARNPEAIDPGSLNVINGFMFGRAPQFDAAATYGDTALSNLLKRITGQPIPYGASDAYAATKAADQDRIASWTAAHPVQGALSSGAGAALNPVNMLAAGALGNAFNGAGATSRLMGFGRAVAGSGALGGAEGAVYGSADPNDPVGGAQRGAVYGALGGAAAVPLGMGASAIVRGLMNSGRSLAAGPLAAFGDAVRNMTPEQIAAAQGIRTDMAGRGVNVSVPEAVQQVTNGATPLGRMLRVLESTKRGEQLLSPYFANRTGQVQNAVGAFADRVADPINLPSAIGPRAQQAAQSGLDDVRVNINEAARPHYDAMAGSVQPGGFGAAGAPSQYVAGPGQSIPLDAYRPLASNQAYRQALANVRGDPMLNAGIAHLPEHDTSVINEVVKELDRLGTASAQTATNPNGNNFVASQYGNARGLADEIATLHSPQWRAARDTVAAGRQWLLDPLEAGPVGQIARTDSVPGQASALYPAKPLNGAPAETATAMQVLNNQFPGVGADLTRQHIMMSLDGARPEIASGQNPYVGPAFAVKVAGSPERQAALMAGVQNIGPHGPAAADDLANLLDGLRATGKRQPVGSRTAFNESDLQDWHVPKAARVLESFSLAEPFEPIAQILKGMNYRRNVNGLADYMTTPADQTADLLNRAQQAAPPPVPISLPALPYNVAGYSLLPQQPTSARR